MSTRIICDQCGDNLEEQAFLRWEVSGRLDEYKFCCLKRDCLASAAEADEFTDLDIACAGCDEGIFDGPGYLRLPAGLYVHDHRSCLARYLVRRKKAEALND